MFRLKILCFGGGGDVFCVDIKWFEGYFFFFFDVMRYYEVF